MTATTTTNTLIAHLKSVHLQLRRIRALSKIETSYSTKVELNVLTYLLGECEKIAKQNKVDLLALPDRDVVKLLRKYVKTAGETAGLTKDEVIVRQATLERDFVSTLVPPGMSAEDIITIVGNLLMENETAGIGHIVKFFKENYDGEYDPATLTDISKRMIQ